MAFLKKLPIESNPGYKGGVLCSTCKKSVDVSLGFMHCKECMDDYC